MAKRAVFLATLLVVIVYVADDYWPSLFAEALPPADAIIVHKAERRLDLMSGDEVIKSYAVSLGGNPIGHKEQEGDSRTPEGAYSIDWRNEGSRYYRSLHISYPNAADTQRAQSQGRSPGGDIMIHGVPSGLGLFGALFRGRDWTDGCVAVSTVEMAEIWSSVANGVPIEIRP
ncbi:MAG: L,D-transpeptidase family protein [Pseudomonadota bacterium]